MLAFKRGEVLTPKRYETLIKKSGNQKIAAAGARLFQGAKETSPPHLIDECLANRSMVVSILMLGCQLLKQESAVYISQQRIAVHSSSAHSLPAEPLCAH